MDGFDLVLLIGVAYVAATSLVRLMLARRNRLIQDLHKQLEAQMRGRAASGQDMQSKHAA